VSFISFFIVYELNFISHIYIGAYHCISMQTNAYAVADVAELCGVHRNTVYNWIKNRRLNSVRISQKRQFIRPEEMKRFVDANLIDAQVG